MELQRRKGVARQLLTFAAVVVGEPHNAARVITLDKHHARAGTQVAADGGQGHGIGLGHFGVNGFFEPLVKLLHGVSCRGRLVELGAFVAFAKVGNVAHGQSVCLV